MDLIWWTDGNETKVMQGLIDEYEQLHPNIKINLQEIAFDDLNTKLQMSIAGGEAPAMSRGTEGTVSQLHDAMSTSAITLIPMHCKASIWNLLTTCIRATTKLWQFRPRLPPMA